MILNVAKFDEQYKQPDLGMSVTKMSFSIDGNVP